MSVYVDGIVQSEKSNGVVTIPFECEYSLHFVNKHNRRAVVKIYIDGSNVSGGGYVINSHSTLNIQRHSDQDRAFKFVDLDSKEAKIAGKSGSNKDKTKGTIEARFYLEKKLPQQPIVIEKHHHHHHDYDPWVKPYQPYDPYRPYKPYQPVWINSQTDDNIGYNCQTGGSTLRCSSICSSLNSQGEQKTSSIVKSLSNILSDGCTVKGNSTGQSFYNIDIDLEDTYTSLKLFLQGYKVNNIKKAIRAGGVRYCDECGAQELKKNSNFCHICGNRFTL